MANNIISTGKQTIIAESHSVAALVNYINEDFEKAVSKIFESKGRLVISGIGKSAIIAQKIVASLNSTGTPSLFLHAADAIHGDIHAFLVGGIKIGVGRAEIGGGFCGINAVRHHSACKHNALFQVPLS